MNRKYISNEKGVATLIALIMVGMLTLIGIAAMSTSDDEVSIAGNELNETKAFYAAEAGLEVAAARLHQLTDSIGFLTGERYSGHGNLNGSSYEFVTVEINPQHVDAVNGGILSGMHARIATYAIRSTGLSTVDNAKVVVAQNFERALIPAMQYAIFSHDDLELNLSNSMTFLGRIHTNGNLWVQSNADSYFDSYVTASGNILHGHKSPGVNYNGDILIKNGEGIYESMLEHGHDWLEATDDHWYDSSISRWDGRVQDSTHGQGVMVLPLLDASGDPHKLIEPDNGSNPDSYENDATIKIINNKVYEKVGSVWNNVTADWNSLGIISKTNDKFYDQQEGEWVDATDLDIGAMYSNGYYPSNGIIYFADAINGTHDYPALRINNAETIADSIGLTIACENPLYTKGDINKTDKKPMSIVADAITVLSSNFVDASSTLLKTDRNALSTVLNAAIVTGNQPLSDTVSNGGVESILRFLEDWTGDRLDFTGSLLNLWYSKQATGLYNTSYFSSPVHNWTYDELFDYAAFMPPGAVTFEVLLRTGWRQEYVGFIHHNPDTVQIDGIL